MPSSIFVILSTIVGGLFLFQSSLWGNNISLILFAAYYLLFKLFPIPLGKFRMTVSETLILAWLLYQGPNGAVWMVFVGQTLFWLYQVMYKEDHIDKKYFVFKIFRLVIATGCAGFVLQRLNSTGSSIILNYCLMVLSYWAISSGLSVVYLYLTGVSVLSFYPKEIVLSLIYYRVVLALVAPNLAQLMRYDGNIALMGAAIVLLALAHGFASNQLKKTAESSLWVEHEVQESLRKNNQKMTNLYNEVSQQAKELSLLYNVSRLINSSVVSEQDLRSVLDAIAKALESDNVTVFLLNNNRDQVYCIENLLEDPISLKLSATNKGPIVTAIQERITVYWEQGEETDQDTQDFFYKYNMSFVLVVPINFGSELIGVLCIANYRYKELQENTKLIEALSDQLGTAVEQLKRIKQMKNLAVTDGLTGVFNYRYFANALEYQRMSFTPAGCLALIVLDIDLFKNINDTYGHQVGDLVLQQLAKSIKDNMRQDDIVCRTGGEEFTIIMPSTTLERGSQVAERLRQAVEMLDFSHFGLDLPVTISVGVAATPENTPNIMRLPKLADEAMYQAKRNGRNLVGVSVVAEHAETVPAV